MWTRMHLLWVYWLGPSSMGDIRAKETQSLPKSAVERETGECLQAGSRVRWTFRMGTHAVKRLTLEASLEDGGFLRVPEGRDGFPGSRTRRHLGMPD